MCLFSSFSSSSLSSSQDIGYFYFQIAYILLKCVIAMFFYVETLISEYAVLYEQVSKPLTLLLNCNCNVLCKHEITSSRHGFMRSARPHVHLLKAVPT